MENLYNFLHCSRHALCSTKCCMQVVLCCFLSPLLHFLRPPMLCSFCNFFVYLLLFFSLHFPHKHIEFSKITKISHNICVAAQKYLFFCVFLLTQVNFWFWHRKFLGFQFMSVKIQCAVVLRLFSRFKKKIQNVYMHFLFIRTMPNFLLKSAKPTTSSQCSLLAVNVLFKNFSSRWFGLFTLRQFLLRS